MPSGDVGAPHGVEQTPILFVNVNSQGVAPINSRGVHVVDVDRNEQQVVESLFVG